MKELNEDQISFLKDLLKSEGWKIYAELLKKDIEMDRRIATRQETQLEDRLWHSAKAEGTEKALELLARYF
jgi:hypothetical protein|tara:strand:+ start:68 stop:280 length:213 start_codon:yes stop_codon:yes gene_type:complete